MHNKNFKYTHSFVQACILRPELSLSPLMAHGYSDARNLYNSSIEIIAIEFASSYIFLVKKFVSSKSRLYVFLLVPDSYFDEVAIEV